MTTLRPGDVVVSEGTGYLWWVHGDPNTGLFATGVRGRCLPLPEASNLYGRMSVVWSSANHQLAYPPLGPR